jgi:glycine/D-amino acid oxidase-like deaminating enzyme/nitrite reductase/ring-hydroxylating ferredoxin subunit
MVRERITYWTETADRFMGASLNRNLKVDVAIVGAGITGLTTALHLARQGKSVAILESRHIGSGTSGATNAHLASEYDHDYSELSRSYGDPSVRLIQSAMSEAIDIIESNVNELSIDCDFQRIPGYYYSEGNQHADLLRQEASYAEIAGQRTQITEDIPLPFLAEIGMKVENQARFHPIRYLNGIATAVTSLGGKIFENSRVVDFKIGEPCTLTTDSNHTVTATDMVFATHTPLGINAVQSTLEPMLSFIIVAKVRNPPADALFWDTADPYHYIRLVDGKNLVMIGGKDQKTGTKHADRSIRALEVWTRERFDVESIEYQWSAQFFEPTGSLPLIGRSPLSTHSYLATGFSGDGMTMGTIAGKILSEQILGRETSYDSVFRPTRMHLSGLKNFLHENFHVAKHFVLDRILPSADSDLGSLRPGEGCIAKVDGEHVAAFRNSAGSLETFSAVCPHMKCLVHWNAASESFDCPCHGSRFNTQGEVLEGPALHALSSVDVAQTQKPRSPRARPRTAESQPSASA